jgi:hypothetical protein
MDPFAFLRRKRSAEQLLREGRRSELLELIPIYPIVDLALPAQGQHYPRAISLKTDGLGAYLLDVHLGLEHLTQIEHLIERLGFRQQLQTVSFETFFREGTNGEIEAVSIQKEALGNGATLLLISNSIELLHSLPDLAPPLPWDVFPEVDADELGALQGSLEHWWNHYWSPYWNSLSPQQRTDWLSNTSHPESWREYIQLQSTLNGIELGTQA